MKQLEDDKSLRNKMSEQITDLQRQLKNEREDSKNMKKRIQILEVEGKRTTTARRNSDAGAAAVAGVDTESISQELQTLKKDAATAERLAKQADANSKAKDIQYKRATETLLR